MTRHLYAIIVGFLIGAIAASLAFGQTSDEPWLDNHEVPIEDLDSQVYRWQIRSAFEQRRLDFINSRAIPFPRLYIEPLQVLLDGPETIIDLKGQTLDVGMVYVHAGNSGKTIKNGKLHLLPGANVASIALFQGRRWGGIDGAPMASGPDLTLQNVTITGDADFDYGFQERNEQVADSKNMKANAISNITNTVGTVKLLNVEMRCLGNSGIALSCRHLYIDGLFGYRVAKHLVGSRAVSGCVTEIKNLQADCVGNALCLDGEAGLLPVESTALVEDFVSRNARGRAKCDGNNWAIEGVAWEFYQDSLLNLNYWPAFDLARRPRRCNIDGFVSVNYTKTGFGSNTDPSTSEGTTLNNVKITNSMSAFKLNQQMTINNSRRYGIHHAYRGNGPSSGSTNNVDVFTLSDAQWAKILDDQNTLMAAANTEWQTQFQPANVWVPKVISDIMVTQ